MLSAFQWKSPLTNPGCTLPPSQTIYETTYPVPITEITNRPPEAEPIREKPTYLNPVETTEPIYIDEPNIDIPKGLPIAPVTIPLDFSKTEAVIDTFLMVENMPLPKNGYEGFYKFLSMELKYPRPAMKSDTQGKVFIEFVINKDGEPSNLRVIKGIGFGCDEEALRVISLTKWNPGKQRGVPVNVRMTLPIQFQLR